MENYLPILEALGVAVIASIPGVLAFFIQRRKVAQSAAREKAELESLRHSSVVSLVKPLQEQVEFLGNQVEELQTELDNCRKVKHDQARRLVRMIDGMADMIDRIRKEELEKIRNRILELDKENGEEGT